MKKISQRQRQENNEIVRKPIDLSKKLNYNILSLLNRTQRVGVLELPEIHCNTETIPDYLALYRNPKDYGSGLRTAVCFYEYDVEFDGKNGLYWAIYYKDEARLNFFIERFRNVRYFIAPDYTAFGDIHAMENLYRLWKSRIVMLWLVLELGAVVIPSVIYWSEESFPVCFDGLETCSVIAMSTKGHVNSPDERELFKKVIAYAVDHLPLRTIVVYSVCKDDKTCLSLFQYAIAHGIRVFIPKNSLRERNRQRNGAV